MKRIGTLILIFMLAGMVGGMTVMAQDGTARMRFGHFSPDLELLDVYVNGQLVEENFDFPDLTDWQEFDPGIVEIAITEPNTSPACPKAWR
ncbi:MAG: DUF4397 domain-containing protein [Chloroflexota bacterium]